MKLTPNKVIKTDKLFPANHQIPAVNCVSASVSGNERAVAKPSTQRASCQLEVCLLGVLVPTESLLHLCTLAASCTLDPVSEFSLLWVTSIDLALSSSQTLGILPRLNRNSTLEGPSLYPGDFWQCLRQVIRNSILFISAIFTNTHLGLTISPANSKGSPRRNSFNRRDHPRRWLVTWSACHTWRHWSPSRTRNFPEVTQPVSGRAPVWLPENKLKTRQPPLSKIKVTPPTALFYLVVKSMAPKGRIPSILPPKYSSHPSSPLLPSDVCASRFCHLWCAQRSTRLLP